MFDTDYTFEGKHANFVKNMSQYYCSPKNDDVIVKEKRYFDRNLDILIVSPLVGLLTKTKADPDKNKDIKPVSILASQISPNKDLLKSIFITVLLIDQDDNLSITDRYRICFDLIERPSSSLSSEEISLIKQAIGLFDSYTRGGLEYLHKELFESAQTPNTCIEELLDKLKDIDLMGNNLLEPYRV